MYLKEALAITVESGCDAVCRGYHLYRDSIGKYTLLTFSKDKKKYVPIDETFDDIDEAIEQFIERAKL